jgi:hypothetical protein
VAGGEWWRIMNGGVERASCRAAASPAVSGAAGTRTKHAATYSVHPYGVQLGGFQRVLSVASTTCWCTSSSVASTTCWCTSLVRAYVLGCLTISQLCLHFVVRRICNGIGMLDVW